MYFINLEIEYITLLITTSSRYLLKTEFSLLFSEDISKVIIRIY
jgi:hypothetical protein